MRVPSPSSRTRRVSWPTTRWTTGRGPVVSVSIFEDRAGAEESNRIAAEWVGHNLAAMLPNPPEVIVGEVGAGELNLTRVGIHEVRE
jgi:hypothetical protein